MDERGHYWQTMQAKFQGVAVDEGVTRTRRPVPLCTRTLIVIAIIMCSIYYADAAINPQTILKCLPRQYTYRASKTTRINGRLLKCFDDVTVYSCWGRCDSYEYGDYKIPYKVSYHPVCTYTSQTVRPVRLRNCHPDHPDPVYHVFDATACKCSMCDSDNTSCENLNG